MFMYVLENTAEIIAIFLDFLPEKIIFAKY